MKLPTRIELIDSQAVVSLPLRLPKVLIPHAVLITVIVLAWTVDFALSTASWIVGA